MFVITLEAVPQPGTKQADQVGGAYAVCWIDFQMQDGAEHLSKFYVEQGGWLPKGIQNAAWVDAEYYHTTYAGKDKEELKQYFTEAEEYGFCIAFYEWPIDAEDA